MARAFSLDRHSPVPLYFQLSQELERAIREGDVKPGEHIETEVELANRLGLSRPTVRQAVQDLLRWTDQHPRDALAWLLLSSAYQAQGDELLKAKADATLLWIKAQEDAGLDIVGDGEQARQHFVHGFLEQVEGIDFENKVKMGIRNNRYDAMVPQVVSALKLKGNAIGSPRL